MIEVVKRVIVSVCAQIAVSYTPPPGCIGTKSHKGEVETNKENTQERLVSINVLPVVEVKIQQQYALYKTNAKNKSKMSSTAKQGQHVTPLTISLPFVRRYQAYAA